MDPFFKVANIENATKDEFRPKFSRRREKASISLLLVVFTHVVEGAELKPLIIFRPPYSGSSIIY